MSIFKKQTDNSGTTLKQLRESFVDYFADKKQLHNEKNLHNPTTIGMYRPMRQTHGTAR